MIFLKSVYSFIALFFILISISYANGVNANVIISKDNNLSHRVHILIDNIKADPTIICDKNRYHLALLSTLLNRYEYGENDLVDMLKGLSFEISSLYKHDLAHGCLDPYAMLPDEIAPEVAQSTSIEDKSIFIVRLENLLSNYIKIAQKGKWKPIDNNFYILKKGDNNPEIIEIKKRLGVSIDLNQSKQESERFDANLENAVKRFQIMHDLKSDGIVGQNTLRAMNVPIKKKIALIKINIERLRWLTDGTKNFIAVNIPSFSLNLYRNNKCRFSMKAIVGKKSRHTALMSERMTYVVINPFWRSPKTILEKDILPKLKKGQFDYLEKKGIYASRDIYGKNTVKFSDINWSKYSVDNVPFIFLQYPGVKNYLGFIKFMFPNAFDIYIHDTPESGLFDYRKRLFSSGCVRVQKPIELFHELVNYDDKNRWTYKNILEHIIKKDTQNISLPKPMKTYILYMTVAVDDNGSAHFYKDVYGYDKKMLDKLKF